jgi:hypothetical protein
MQSTSTGSFVPARRCARQERRVAASEAKEDCGEMDIAITQNVVGYSVDRLNGFARYK